MKDTFKHFFNSTFWTMDVFEDFIDGFLIKIAFVVLAIGIGKYKGNLTFHVITALTFIGETILTFQYVYQEARAGNLAKCSDYIFGQTTTFRLNK